MHTKLAKALVCLIPASCPFAKDINAFGMTIHIPPLCKLNPFYNQLVALRFQSLEYLEKLSLH